MLNVVVYHRLDEIQLRRLAAISPAISVRVGLPAHRLAEASGKTTGFPPSDINALLPEADVLYAFRLPDGIRERARRLKWLQFATAGADQAIAAGLFGAGLLITTSTGIHAIPMGEYAIAAMLMLAHRFHHAARQQAAHIWKPWDSAELTGKTLGVVGYGHIGRHIAGLALGFGMRVVATRRSATAAAVDQLPSGTVDIVPADELHALLSQSDYVVLVVPLVAGTERLIGEAELAVMKPAACLINMARGRVVDQAALTRALGEGRIAGACLDVFEKEPLPPDDPLWDMPNVIITPHCAGSHERYDERAAALFLDNLERYVAGKPMLNVVDEARGY